MARKVFPKKQSHWRLLEQTSLLQKDKNRENRTNQSEFIGCVIDLMDKYIFEYEKRMKSVSTARRGVPRRLAVFVFGKVFIFNFGDFLSFLFDKFKFFIEIHKVFFLLIQFLD
jgi:hypothetical protein